MVQSIQDVLTLAREQLQRGRLQESEDSFRRVVTSGQFVAQGLYGIGIVRYKLHDLAAARYYLLQALQQDPGYADTSYQLGVVAQEQQDWEEARSYFRKTLAIEPQHILAQQALAQLPGNVVPGSLLPVYPPSINSEQGDDPHNMPTVSSGPMILAENIQKSYGSYQAKDTARKRAGAGQVANSYVQPQQYGAYDFLRDDPSRRAQNTLAVIDALRIKGHPSLSAYLGSFMPGIFGAILLIAFGISLSMLSTGALDKTTAMITVVLLGLGGLWGIFAAIGSLLRYLRIVSMEYKIDQGRFQIRQGIFGKTTRTYELMRVHNIELKQSLINRLTGDGTLIFHIENETQPLVVKGLVKGKKLEETYQQFLTLVSLLRFNPSAKGFIQ